MSTSSIPGLDRVPFTEEQIDQRLREIAPNLAALPGPHPADRRAQRLHLLPDGARRYLEVPVKSTSGDLKPNKRLAALFASPDLDEAIEGRMSCWWKTSSIPVSPFIPAADARRPPNSLSVCVPRPQLRRTQVPVDYRCFEIRTALSSASGSTTTNSTGLHLRRRLEAVSRAE